MGMGVTKMCRFREDGLQRLVHRAAVAANEASDEGLKGSREGGSGRISSSEWRAGYLLFQALGRPSRSSRRSSRMQ
ncbi:hypothetical protein BHM03_00018032 [Ensete ventricosum]|uniref:Uncharacterized protein n=1 Tax=Ensete ventricosum TaxID=4639 RepID=A0A426XXH5_ENSVE|nr:hypothetical protein B296_00054255 [Ensete ventricosum]RZR90181.1 hypothetical protein BHM03_00018032 [Ensete ventricosum]